MPPPSNQTRLLRDTAYQKIKRAIISGEYEANSILYESLLAKTLDMSRTPVREALMRLSEEGLVKNLPNNGFLVAAATLKEIEEIFDLRLCLEKYVVEKVLSNRSPVDYSEMSNLINAQSEALGKNDFWTFFEKNHLFHIELVKLANNGTVTRVMQGLREKPIQSGFHALRHNARLADAIDEHIAIIDALKNRDRDRAVKEITRHALNAKKRLLGIDT